MKKLLILFLALLMLAAIPAQMTSCALNVKASELSAGYTAKRPRQGRSPTSSRPPWRASPWR